jgi:hypothetical protein
MSDVLTFRPFRFVETQKIPVEFVRETKIYNLDEIIDIFGEDSDCLVMQLVREVRFCHRILTEYQNRFGIISINEREHAADSKN